MKRVAAISPTYFALLLAAPAVVLADDARDIAQRPNIVLIFADDLGINDLGCYGRKDHRTPNLDRLASQGMRFTCAYTAQPICSPSRAALMTGKCPARLNLTNYLPGRPDAPSQRLLQPRIEGQLPLEEVTLAEVLKNAGYATGLFGKWHLGGRGFGPAEQGLDVAVSPPATNEPTLQSGGKGEFAIAAAAEKFIEDNRDRPFFCYVPHNSPHIPLSAAPELVEKHRDAYNPAYAAMIETLDDSVGRLMAKIESLGLADRTIILFTSDNGGLHVLEFPGTPATHNGPFRAGKGYLYEGGLREPLIVRWPGVIAAGSTCEAPIVLTDLFPTLLEAAGIDVAQTVGPVDGVSIKTLLSGGSLPPRTLYWHFPNYTNQGGRPAGAIRDGDWKLIEHFEDESVELFNLANDNAEANNQAATDPARTNDLRRKLHTWRTAVGARMPTPNPEFDAALHQRLYVNQDPSQLSAASTAAATAPQWKAWREAMSAAIKGRAPSVTPATGDIRLQAKDARIHGQTLRYEPQPHKNVLGYWTNANDWAEWEFETATDCDYDVEIQHGCGKGSGGAEVAVQIDDETLKFTVQDTGHFQKLILANIGQANLATGKHMLAVKPQTKPGAAVMDLRRVVLRPTATSASKPELREREDPLMGGAFAINITPVKFPVIVNGSFEERTADRAVDPLFARAFVLASGRARIAIVVVDNCMLPRELLDDVKERASKLTGIPVEHMLISATHTHSAPAAMGCLGSRADPEYPAFLVPQLVRAIQKANESVQPVKVGWAKVRAPQHTFCRSYIRRPDRILNDPFGEPTVRANMHPGFLSPDVVGPAGPVDDELSIVAMQTLDGKPLGVLANFSMHYIGSPPLSADYFGRFSEKLAKHIDGSDGATDCIVAMSQGTSGDLWAGNYSAPAAPRDYDRFAQELAEIAHGAYRQINYQSSAPLAMRESKLTLRRRVPDAARLNWAKTVAESIGDRRPKGLPEVYALEQLMLAAEPERTLKLQALRIGDVGIAAIPNEVLAITGLKLKRQSPLPVTFNIELANGAEGYIPPPEQHKLGGYTSWPARTAGLEVDAEPKIVEALLQLLEAVAGKRRLAPPDTDGKYAAAVLQSKPRGYWRLCEIAGNVAKDVSGNNHHARYEDGVALYLPGPPSQGFSEEGQLSRSAHFAGGRVRSDVPNISSTYSVELWFWNGLPNDVRAVTGYLFSHVPDQDDQARGDHIGIGGTDFAQGRLFFFNGNQFNQRLEGRTIIEPKSWNHVVLVREGEKVRVYLNGQTDPEIVNDAGNHPDLPNKDWFFGGRHDGFSNFEGKLGEAAIYDRALTHQEVSQHFRASGLGRRNGQ